MSVTRGVPAVVLALAVLALAGAASPAAAQSETEAVLAPVRQLFDAMRSRDTAALRAAFHPEARLVTTREYQGETQVRVGTIDGFVGGVGAAPVTLDERVWDVEVRVDASLATVWAKYDFVAGGEFSHCGVDAFQLVRVAGAWKIIAIADTQRRENCWRAP